GTGGGRTEGRVAAEEAGGGVAVARARAPPTRPNFQVKPPRLGPVNRRQPDRCHAQVLEINQMPADSGKVASVVGVGRRAVEHGIATARFVVPRLAVGEAIRHYQIDYVVGPERLGVTARGGGGVP